MSVSDLRGHDAVREPGLAVGTEAGETPLVVPRLPVLAWSTFAGPKRSPLPSVLDAGGLSFTTSGRAAIALALRALGVGSGARVLVPSYHCPTMIAPVVAAGAEPVFFPIDETGAPRLEAFGDYELRHVRAILAAHYFGLPQPMEPLRAFCDEYGIALIEDCAHALFGLSDGRPVGQWGDCAVASLTKFLPVVDGGCLVARNVLSGSPKLVSPSISLQLKSIANSAEIGARHGGFVGMNGLLNLLFSTRNRLRSNPSPDNGVAQPSRTMDVTKWLADFEPPSAFLRAASWWTRWTVRHAHRARIVELRRRNYQALARLLSDIPDARPLMPALPAHAAPYVFPIFVDSPHAIYHEVRASGIPVFRWDERWPTCPLSRGDVGNTWSIHVFQIGCHQDLRLEDIERIASTLRGIVQRAASRARRPLAAPAY